MYIHIQQNKTVRLTAVTLIALLVFGTLANLSAAATNNVLLLHMDGADASTTFIDHSSFASSTTVIANGNAQVDTAQSKFSGAAGLFDGTGDYLSIPDSPIYEVGAKDFTIDVWVRPASVSGTAGIISKADGSNYSPFLIYRSTTSYQLYATTAAGSWNVCNATSIGTAAADTWAHLAVVRNGNVITTYKDGTAVATCSTNGALFDNTGSVLVGTYTTGSQYFNGHIDEVRISIGVARWTANFTAPTAAYGAEDVFKRIVLTSGTSWVVPSDWNSSNNTIEVIAGGGGGGGTTSGGVRAGSGGGGGSYSHVSNVSLTGGSTVTYAVGAGGAAGATNTTGGTGGDTYFCNSTSNCASIAGSAVVVGAKGGTGAIANTGGAVGIGGSATTSVGTTKYAGGSGAVGVANGVSGGGGGAAGPNGPGGNANYGVGGSGGAARGGAGGALHQSGFTGAEWGGVGSGGGAGGRGPSEATGMSGISYGSGGGGYYATANNGSGGAGGPGIVVITYVPAGSFGVTIHNGAKFLSNLDVRGNVSKGSGTFFIDHPQAPATKLLYHSFVESPDAKNIYDGIAQFDEKGEAAVTLPDYFETLNKDFRYQFLPLNEAMPDLYIKSKVKNNMFTIGGGIPGEKVSWQVTGTRHDPYILTNPIRTEVEKGPNELVNKGECLFEPLCQ